MTATRAPIFGRTLIRRLHAVSRSFLLINNEEKEEVKSAEPMLISGQGKSWGSTSYTYMYMHICIYRFQANYYTDWLTAFTIRSKETVIIKPTRES